MKEKERIALIRQGNEYFNQGNIELAQKYFLKTNYHDGLQRIADYYFYEKKLPLNALPFYMKCSAKEKVAEIYQRIAFAMGKLIKQDSESQSNNEPASPSTTINTSKEG
jgi:hypothetical protein